jgi:prevent-host-death family protein
VQERQVGAHVFGAALGPDTGVFLASVEQMYYTQTMERIAVRDLNQRTSQMLDRVRRGETLIVTDHGEPVARLSPIGNTRTVLDLLISQGKAIPPRTTKPFPAPVSFGDASIDSTAVVRSMRDEE